MKFKEGDKVRVKRDLKEGYLYGGYLVVEEMASLKGEEFTIESIVSPDTDQNGFGYYCLKDSIWKWTDNMLEPVEEKVEIDRDKLFQYALKRLGVTKEKLIEDCNKEIENIDKITFELTSINKDFNEFCSSSICATCKIMELNKNYPEISDIASCIIKYYILRKYGGVK